MGGGGDHRYYGTTHLDWHLIMRLLEWFHPYISELWCLTRHWPLWTMTMVREYNFKAICQCHRPLCMHSVTLQMAVPSAYGTRTWSTLCLQMSEHLVVLEHQQAQCWHEHCPCFFSNISPLSMVWRNYSLKTYFLTWPTRSHKILWFLGSWRHEYFSYICPVCFGAVTDNISSEAETSIYKLQDDYIHLLERCESSGVHNIQIIYPKPVLNWNLTKTYWFITYFLCAEVIM